MRHMFYAGDEVTCNKVEELLKSRSIEYERKKCWFYFDSKLYKKELMNELFFFIDDLYRKTKRKSARVL